MDRTSRERIKRIHAWTGIAPLGLFVVVHLAGNATSVWGRGAFERHLARVDALPGHLLGELLLIALPLVVHVALGVRLMTDPAEATSSDGPIDRGRTLQRATALVALVFIAVHLGHARWPRAAGALTREDLYDRLSTDLQGMGWLAVYLVGCSAVVLHLSHGLWRRWLETRTAPVAPGARRRVALACGALGICLWLVVLEVLGHFYAGTTLAQTLGAAVGGAR